MPIPITIPRLGWSMDEGSFTGWLKKEGELVNAGEPLFTLESEKAAQDIEAADSGVLQLQPDSPNPGDVVKVGQVIGLLLAEADQAKDASTSAPPAGATGSGGQARGVHAASTPPNPEPLLMVDATSLQKVKRAEARTPQRMDRHLQPDAPPAASAETVAEIKSSVESQAASEPVPPAPKQTISAKSSPAISPRARRRATELGVDATRLKGSGRTGRVVEADVLKSAQSISAPATSVMRRLIAQRTALSFATIPHFYLRREVDVTALIRLREDLLPEIESRAGVRLTLSDLLLRAQALALRDFPAASAIWLEGNLVRLPGCDVGLVVGLPEGLMIPVVRSAHEGDLAMLAKQRAALVASAKAGRLTQEEMQGGATALSNLGNSPVDEFTAVISPGQSSMLAVGCAAPRPFVLAGKLAVRTTLKLCLSVDHRAMDGGPAANFLGRIVELLESPKALLDDRERL